MGSACGDGCGDDLSEASRVPGYVGALRIVVALNAAMFVIGGALALNGRSVAVQADALDFLGDALATGIGLLLVGASVGTRSLVALWQGLALGALGVYTLGSALWRVIAAVAPDAMAMGAYGVLGLGVNLGSALLLLRHRHGDASVRAVWLYSRNDAIGNVAVLAAAGFVAGTATRWADLAVGGALAALFLHSAYEILRQSILERHALRSQR
jgi:Co/Zn/Cd efflux system component